MASLDPGVMMPEVGRGIAHSEGLAIVKEAVAAETKASASPVKALAEQDVYYPGTEDLAPDEMRAHLQPASLNM